ncbi:zinc-finger domain-containing protein [Aliikangiella coralliicola]|uniref:Zinc-finger domain-containing protein n=1 Tax=Aliikangiella coralliicola TaxID=2592383 RepID=A0A545UDY0_9GAMM|nr:zinc-finger domain-containing protein [Aliikangiella coralliicola]TQV87677.1 zinc-finger domain-containing protein [Aliikangiella coralliicola]
MTSSPVTSQSNNANKAVIKVAKDALPACCPPKDEEHWNQHPRVYLPLKTGEADCPYCGNHFELEND